MGEKITFMRADADRHGIDGAMFISRLRYWVLRNRSKGTNAHEGRTWSYAKHETLAAYLFSSVSSVKRLVLRLERDGVILRRCAPGAGLLNVAWYAFADEAHWLDGAPAQVREPVLDDSPDPLEEEVERELVAMTRRVHGLKVIQGGRSGQGPNLNRRTSVVGSVHQLKVGSPIYRDRKQEIEEQEQYSVACGDAVVLSSGDDEAQRQAMIVGTMAKSSKRGAGISRKSGEAPPPEKPEKSKRRPLAPPKFTVESTPLFEFWLGEMDAASHFTARAPSRMDVGALDGLVEKCGGEEKAKAYLSYLVRNWSDVRTRTKIQAEVPTLPLVCGAWFSTLGPIALSAKPQQEDILQRKLREARERSEAMKNANARSQNGGK